MEASELFLQIAAILIAARLVAEAGMRIGVPSVIGELATGILLGPSLLGWIEPNEVLRLLAEVGIILLLFEVGLESDIGRLIKSGLEASAVAVAGFVVPFALGFIASRYVFDLSLLVSLFIGGTLTATSIGVTVRILADVGRPNSREGQIVLGAAVLDDVMGVLLLALLYDFAVTGELNLENSYKLALFVGIFFVTAPIAAKAASSIIRHYHRRSALPGVLTTMVVSLVLLLGWLAHAIGAPEILGGFAAGLALSRRFFLPFGAALASDHQFSEQIEDSIRPIAQLFKPIFFVVVGLSLDLTQVDWGSWFFWLFSVGIAAIAIVGKILSGYVLFREHWLTRTAVGMAMVPRGEVGLIFAELGRSSGILNAEVYAGVIMVVAYTTLFSPFWIKLFYRLFGESPALRIGRSDTDRTAGTSGDPGGKQAPD